MFYEMQRLVLSYRRFSPWYCEPVIAGLDVTATGSTPFIASMDLIGCINFAKDFVVCGVSAPELYGMCEALWEPELVIIRPLTYRPHLIV